MCTLKSSLYLSEDVPNTYKYFQYVCVEKNQLSTSKLFQLIQQSVVPETQRGMMARRNFEGVFENTDKNGIISIPSDCGLFTIYEHCENVGNQCITCHSNLPI